MVEVEQLGFRTKIDLSGWNDGIKEADAALGDFTRRATDQLDRLPAPRLAAPETDLGSMSGAAGRADDQGSDLAALGSQIERIGVTFSSIGSQIRRGMAEAAAPLHQFAARFAAQFDEVGATVEELAVRIDSAMRFPVFEKRIRAVQNAILKPFRKLPAETKAALAPLAHVEPPFTGIIEDTRQAADQVVRDWHDAGRKIGEYDLLDAQHVRPSAGSFRSWLDAIDSFKSDAVKRMEAARDAILARPGNRGKGSRTAFNRRKANAAQVADMQASRPDMDLKTAATNAKGWLGRIAADPGWGNLAAAGGKIGSVLGDAFKLVGRFARDTAKETAHDVSTFVNTWLGLSKLKGFFASLGSVGNATFGKLARIKLPPLGINPGQLAAVRALGGAADKASTSFAGMARSVAGALGLFGLTYKAVEFLKDGVKEATNLNETLSKTKAVLGAASEGAIAFADGMADRFGLVRRETLDMVSGFAGIGKRLLGLQGKELEEFGERYTKMAADLSSYANMSFEEAGVALRAALTGNESDRLKQLGIITNEAAVEADAWARGLNKSSEEMSELEKVTARGNVLIEKFGKNQLNISGDLDRTADSTANMYRKLTGSLTNLGAEIGTAMLPAVDEGLKLLIGGVDRIKAAFIGSKDIIMGWIEQASAGFDLVAAAIAHPTEAFEVLKLYGKQALANLFEYIGAFAENTTRLAGWIGENWLLLIGDAFEATQTALRNLSLNFAAVGVGITNFLANPMAGIQVNFTPLLDGFRATASKLPELMKPVLTDLSKEIATAGKPIWDDFAKRREAAHAEKPAFGEEKGDALAGVHDKPEKKKKGKKEDQFAGALEVNSKEAYSAYVSAAYGTARKSGTSELEKTSKEQLAANKKGNAILGQIAKAVAGAPPQASFP